MPQTDQPTWLRWHALDPALVNDILQEKATLYLALHVYNNRLAILAVPAEERINLGPAASMGRIHITTVTMTIVRYPSPCTPRRANSTRNRQRKR